jgi:glucose/mannose transport system substrate-binding protein
MMNSAVERGRLRACLVLSLFLMLLLNACSENNGSTATISATNSGTPSLMTTSAVLPTSAVGTTGKQLEIFSWWTNGGEADGLAALFDLYHQRYPTVQIINATVAGGAGTNAKTVLVTRMQGGKAPDSFQVHAGQELIGTWVTANKMEPLTQLFKSEGWDKVLPKLLLDQITYNGEIYSVPSNIHRSNMLWYNKKIFTENHLAPPHTIQDFFEVAEVLKSKNITPLAVGGKDGFEVPHLFESILLATYGADYPKLFQNGGALFADARTGQAIQTLSRMLAYANSDRSALEWNDAAQKVLDGSAAMTIMGDWAEGYFKSKNAQLNQDFGWIAAPGTEGMFLWLSDSFGLPIGAPDRTNTINWLKLIGSKEGQDTFNPKKGSIPARTDANKSLYDAYLQWSIDQFANDKLMPSIVHGAATNEAFTTDYDNALNVFAADLNVKTLTQSLNDAVNDLK